MKQLKLVHSTENLERIRELLRCCFFRSDNKRLDSFISDYTNPDDLSKRLYTWSEDCSGIIGIVKNSAYESEITAISVSPEKRGRSIGRSMIREALEDIGCTTLIAETDDSAVEFYRKCGFHVECLGEKYPGFIRYKCALSTSLPENGNGQGDKVIGPYDVKWAAMFQEISDYLGKNLKTYIRIEHVGSTSIPGMDAKPIIDIDIEIPSRSDFAAIKKELEGIGYSHRGDLGIEGREVFGRVEGKPSLLDEIPHHLYVCTSDSREYKRHILFRDKLRADRALMEEYKAIKYEILEKVGFANRAGYVEMKENNYRDFFERVLNESGL